MTLYPSNIYEATKKITSAMREATFFICLTIIVAALIL